MKHSITTVVFIIASHLLAAQPTIPYIYSKPVQLNDGIKTGILKDAGFDYKAIYPFY